MPEKPAAKPRPAPADIFDIIEEAPSHAELSRPAAQPAEEEGVYEVEPVVEIEESQAREAERVLPVGEKAMEEMREGLGLGSKGKPAEQEIVTFESLDMAASAAQEYRPPEPPRPPEPEEFTPREYVPPPPEPEPEYVPREYVPPRPEPAAAAPAAPLSETQLRGAVEESVARIVREIARETIEKVAWEVIPDLAEMLIKAEIERLKAEQ